jgi:membrane dipeptidase
MKHLNDDNEEDETPLIANASFSKFKTITQYSICGLCLLMIFIFVPGIILIDLLQNLPNLQPEKMADVILKNTPLIDAHNDLPDFIRNLQLNRIPYDLTREPTKEEDANFKRINGFEIQTTISRLREGKLGAQFWSAWVSCQEKEPLKRTLEQIGVIEELVNKHPETFEFAKTASDIESAHRRGKIASLVGIEGGHCIENSILALKGFYNAGARYMTLTHTCNTDWCDSANGPERFGLNDFGKQIIREMNDMGMMVDLSHVSPLVMNITLDVSRSPVIFSHSGARSICNHFRNVPDFIIQRLKNLDGVIMLPFYPVFMSEIERVVSSNISRLNITSRQKDDVFRQWQFENPHLRSNLSQIVDHMDYIKKLNGNVKNIGIGSDFDGIPYLMKGAETVKSYYPLVLEMINRGYSKNEIELIIGRNLLRVMKRNEELRKK